MPEPTPSAATFGITYDSPMQARKAARRERILTTDYDDLSPDERIEKNRHMRGLPPSPGLARQAAAQAEWDRQREAWRWARDSWRPGDPEPVIADDVLERLASHQRLVYARNRRRWREAQGAAS